VPCKVAWGPDGTAAIARLKFLRTVPTDDVTTKEER
jgi:hypothetical protein